MFGADAFLLARIASGGPAETSANYDLSLISPKLLPLAVRLIVAKPAERSEIWDEYLAPPVERAPTLATTPEPVLEPVLNRRFSQTVNLPN